MSNRLKISLYTFFGVGLTIFVIGFVGINLSLKYIQEKYVQLQLDVNKRQAEQMSFFIKNEIKKGVPLDTIRDQFQQAIAGTETDKGFMCMYDTEQDELICHPNKKAIGMKFNHMFVFKDINTNSDLPIADLYKQNKAIGGIFKQADMRTDIVYSVPIDGTNWFLNAHENIQVISREIKMLRYRYIWGSLIFGLLIAITASFTARRIGRNYEKQIELKNLELDKNYTELKELHEEVREQRDVITEKRNFVQKQNEEISAQNKQITDSINYAKRIQAAVLPSINIINEIFPNNFVFFRPKDIVSGDFYWFSSINQYKIVVAADCTGHGVPGAFMSMLGVTLLNEIVNKKQILKADEVLNELREQIIISVSRKGNSVEQKDGMDISICIIDSMNLELQFAGAYNSLYIINKNEATNNWDLQKIKADSMPIGVHPKDNVSFTNHQLKLRKDDRLYMFSDGYVSQFGGEKGEKFKSKRFQELLLSVQDNDITTQKVQLEESLNNWQRDQQQVDDILLIGFQV